MKNEEAISYLRSFADPLNGSSTFCVPDERAGRFGFVSIDIRQVCRESADIIERLEIRADKFDQFVDYARKHGLEKFYERVMHESLDDQD